MTTPRALRVVRRPTAVTVELDDRHWRAVDALTAVAAWLLTMSEKTAADDVRRARDLAHRVCNDVLVRRGHL